MVQILKQCLPGEKKGDTLKLDIDPKSHSAWTGGTKNFR